MKTSSTPHLQHRVLGAFPQEVLVSVRGPDVALFVPNEPQPPDDAIPDPMELLVSAANQQMFSSAGKAGKSSARILERQASVDILEQSWRLRLDNLAQGSLRVLANLLSARELDSASVVTTGASPSAVVVDPMRLAYPARDPDAPFVVDWLDNPRASQDRVVAVEFCEPPADSTIDSLFDSLRVWSDLLLFGGYPHPEMSARESGLMPDEPILLDECTVQLALPQFLCDEASFDAILNHVSSLAYDGVAIARMIFQ